MIAAATHTPLPDIWRMTPGMIARYARSLPGIVGICNPFAALAAGKGKEDGVMRDPAAIRAMISHMGIR